MDPFSVIVMLAIHLVGSGCLMLLVGRLVPDTPGLLRWSWASVLFGLGYLARLFGGLESAHLHAVAFDSVMLLAVLVFDTGVQQFVGREPVRLPVVLGLWAALVLTEAVASWAGGVQARHVALNLMIGALYARVSFTLATELRRQPQPLHTPLALLAVLIGGLSALTLIRAQDLFSRGMGVAFHGLLAQVYYVYASLTAVVVALTLLWLLFLRLNGRLAELATHDALTGVLNRNGLDRALRQHFAQRDAKALTLLLVDIDHFKRINDTHGHAAGDATLKAVAEALRAQLRAGDFIARMGGEEFLIGCVGAQHEGALPLAQRLRAGVGCLAVPSADGLQAMTCTVSVGVSTDFSAYDGWERAAAQADQALYQAKAAGRDGVQPFMAAA